MLGAIFAITSSLFKEVATALGKEEMTEKKESIFLYSFISLVASLVIFIVMVLIGVGSYSFSYASLPSFSIRFIIEVILLFVGARSVQFSDRTTYSYLRILTLPFISFVSAIFGLSSVNGLNILGFCLVTITVAVLFYKEILSRNYALYGLISAILAAFTISLFKYNITNFNSILGEEITMVSLLIIVLVIIIKLKTKESLFSFLKSKLLFYQTASSGVSDVFGTFAYAFLLPVVGVAIGRISEMGFAVISGHKFFDEHNSFKKALFILPLAVGIILLLV